MTSTDINAAALDWGHLLAEHRRWLGTVIRSRLSDPSAVDDLLQEVSLAALKQPNRPEQLDKVAPWLYRIAIRKVINYRRHLGRRRKLLEGFTADRGMEAGMEKTAPGEWLLRREARGEIREALQQLDPGDRQILMLKYTEGWGYRELAAHLGLTVKTVEYRLLRARQALRDVIQHYDGRPVTPTTH